MINVTRGPLSIYSEIFNHKLEPTVMIADFPLKWTVQGMGKLFDSGILDALADVHDSVSLCNQSNWDSVKVRYYHNDEYYDPHTDKAMQFLAFYYINKEPKKYTGGEVYFPKYDYQPPLLNNSMIIMPGWVQHAVKKVSIKDSDYYDGWGRYCISSFFGSKSKSER